MNSFVGTAEYLAPEIISGEGYSPLVDWWALGILLYEMLFEKTPFEGSDMNETFEKIVHFNKKELKIPESNQHGPISKHCRDLIASLLTKDPHARLGHKRGADEIKAHAFFHGVDFNSLSTMQPPIIPQIDSVLDFRNFQQFDKNVDVKKALEESSKKVNDEKSEDLIFELDS
jgi:protein-serine/threonine kinase